MILAAHQPNFLPYMGYFYKMYSCDVFAFSDEVQFARKEFQNYNYICEEGERKKLTVPVQGHTIPYNQVKLSDWEHSRKSVIGRIENAYRRYPYFNAIFPYIRAILQQDYIYLIDLNKALLMFIAGYMRMPCKIINESDLGLEYVDATYDIVTICQMAGCGIYLSGKGAKKYLNPGLFDKSGIRLLWSGYEPLEYGSKIEDGSVLDYLMLCGNRIPEKWKRDREALHGGV